MMFWKNYGLKWIKLLVTLEARETIFRLFHLKLNLSHDQILYIYVVSYRELTCLFITILFQSKYFFKDTSFLIEYL